jgi:hypothetical protein
VLVFGHFIPIGFPNKNNNNALAAATRSFRLWSEDDRRPGRATTAIRIAKSFDTRLGAASDVVQSTNHECYLALSGSAHSTRREEEL